MFFDLNTPEKLYWMSRNNGEQEVGYLLTKEQLLAALPEMYMTGQNMDGSPSYRMRDYECRVPNEKDLDRLLNNAGRSFNGAYSTDDIFSVTEISKRSQVKELMTWTKFKPSQALSAEKITVPYPDYVSPKYRLEKSCGQLECFTSTYLPTQREKNPTVEKYKKQLGIERHNMRYKYSKEQEAAMEIAVALQEGYLTPEVYKDIILSSVLGKEEMAILEEYKENQAEAANVIDIMNAQSYNHQSIYMRVDVPNDKADWYGPDILNAINGLADGISTGYPGVNVDLSYNDMEQEMDDYE